MSASQSAVDRQILALSEISPLKLWSVLTTILGDVAPNKGQEVPGPWLRLFITELGVSPEAYRVAIHRLKKDDWIRSRMEGRVSYLCLSPSARKQTLSVYKRIYHTDPAETSDWSLCVGKIDTVESGRDAIKLFSKVHAVPNRSLKKFSSCLCFDWNDQKIPEQLSQSEIFSELIETATQLSIVLGKMRVSNMDVDSVKVQTIRFLALHLWRRIALKEAAWLHMRHVPNSIISTARTTVHELLDEIPTPKP